MAQLPPEDIRWIQRLDSYQRALAQLQKAVELQRTRPLSELERQGLIQAFEFTHELAWNVMKDYFTYQGDTSITGSRDATRAGLLVVGAFFRGVAVARRGLFAGIVRERIGYEPRSGALFVFFGRRRQTVKVVFADGTGICIFHKRLDQGVFAAIDPPREGARYVAIDDAALVALLDGLDIATGGAAKKPPRRVH